MQFPKAPADFVKRYPITRIISDNDFDGVLCAAMLRNIYPQAEVILSEPSEIHEGRLDIRMDKHTLMCDLAPVEGCGVLFDHHESNINGKEYPGVLMRADSAARLVYEFFNEQFDLSKFREIVSYADQFDIVKFSLEEYLNPPPESDLAYIINSDNLEFNLLLVELLADFEPLRLLEFNLIKEKVKQYHREMKRCKDLMRKQAVISGDVVFVDLREINPKIKINGFTYTAEFLKQRAVVVFKQHQLKDKLKVRLYRNNFYRGENNINLLKIVREIQPVGSGGHTGACGMTLDLPLDLENLQQKITRFLVKQL